MKKKFIYGSLVVICFFTLFSCKKPNDVSPETATSIVGSYIMTKATKFNNGNEVDITYTIPPCSLDNLIQFNLQGQFSENEGATSCTPSYSSSATYKKDGNTVTLIFSSGEFINLTIIKLTATEFVFETYSELQQQIVRVYTKRV
jgi:hypothetical protein